MRLFNWLFCRYCRDEDLDRLMRQVDLFVYGTMGKPESRERWFIALQSAYHRVADGWRGHHNLHQRSVERQR